MIVARISGADSCSTEVMHDFDDELKQQARAYFASKTNPASIIVNNNRVVNPFSYATVSEKKPCFVKPKISTVAPVPDFVDVRPTNASTSRLGIGSGNPCPPRARLSSTGNIVNNPFAMFKAKNLVENNGVTNGGTIFTFSPIYLQWLFRDDNLIFYLAVTISLPSGVSRDTVELMNQVDTTVSECGTMLLVKCVWPRNLHTHKSLEDALTNQGMDRKSVDTIVLGMRSELQDVKTAQNAFNINNVGSTGRIALQSVCETKIVNRVALEDEETAGMQMTVILRLAGQAIEEEEEDQIFYQKYYQTANGDVMEVPNNQY